MSPVSLTHYGRQALKSQFFPFSYIKLYGMKFSVKFREFRVNIKWYLNLVSLCFTYRKRITSNSLSCCWNWSKFLPSNLCVSIDSVPFSLNFYGEFYLRWKGHQSRLVKSKLFFFGRKTSWLSPDDLEIDWRPLHKLSQLFIRKNTSKDELYRYYS